MQAKAESVLAKRCATPKSEQSERTTHVTARSRSVLVPAQDRFLAFHNEKTIDFTAGPPRPNNTLTLPAPGMLLCTGRIFAFHFHRRHHFVALPFFPDPPCLSALREHHHHHTPHRVERLNKCDASPRDRRLVQKGSTRRRIQCLLLLLVQLQALYIHPHQRSELAIALARHGGRFLLPLRRLRSGVRRLLPPAPPRPLVRPPVRKLF